MNEDNINKIYENNNFIKRDHNYDDFIMESLKKRSSFLSYGTPKTRYEGLSQKKLIDFMLDKNFKNLPDEEQCAVFQEFHNRLAQRLSIPAINVYVLKKEENGDFLGCVTKRISMDYLYETDGKEFPNIQLEINNKQEYGIDVDGIKMKPSTNGLENIATIIHETRHVAQFYAGSFFTRPNQLRNENEINASKFLGMFDIILSILGAKMQPKSAIKNKKISQSAIEFLSEYKLNAEEIDARMFAFQEMERLAQKGYFDNTNWKTFRGAYIVDEFDALNFFRDYAQDECPTIRFLKEKKRLIDIELKKRYKKDFGKGVPKEITELENSIDFEEFYGKIQEFYNDLKSEIHKIMVEESNTMVENSKSSQEDIDPNYYYKLRYGSDNVCNTNEELYDSVLNQYKNEHKPVLMEQTKIKNKNNYLSNKQIRDERKNKVEDEEDRTRQVFEALSLSKRKPVKKEESEIELERE